jgi:hypothetical protein
MRLQSIVLFTLMLVGCNNGELQRIEKFSGVALPNDIAIVSKIDNWVSPNGEGFSLRIYRITGKSLWIDEDNCSKKGFKKKKLIDMSVRLPVIERYLAPDLPVCYKFESNATAEEEQAIFIQGGSIYYFWAAW